MPYNQPSHPQSSPSPAFNLSQHQGLFKWVLNIRWPKDWSFSFNINPSNEYSGLISFRIDWLDLLAVQGTLKSLLQHHSSKASIFQCSAFFTVQLSHPYVTTGKTIALTNLTLYLVIFYNFTISDTKKAQTIHLCSILFKRPLCVTWKDSKQHKVSEWSIRLNHQLLRS